MAPTQTLIFALAVFIGLGVVLCGHSPFVSARSVTAKKGLAGWVLLFGNTSGACHQCRESSDLNSGAVS
jgi:hypothetical protein